MQHAIVRAHKGSSAGRLAAPPGRIRRIVESAKRYGRTVQYWRCRYSEKVGGYLYEVVLAKRRSGSRSGPLMAYRGYTFFDLWPEQRAMFKRLGLEPGVQPFD